MGMRSQDYSKKPKSLHKTMDYLTNSQGPKIVHSSVIIPMRKGLDPAEDELDSFMRDQIGKFNKVKR